MGNKNQLSDRGLAIQRASWVGIIGNGLLAALKIVIGTISGSAAVVADGVDSAAVIVVHEEPIGNDETEQFGLSPDDFREDEDE